MARMYFVILALAIAETAWALLCAVTNLDLVLFYVGLVAASVVFFIHGNSEKGGSAP